MACLLKRTLTQLLIVASFVGSQSMDYTDLQTLGASCFPRDTCSSRTPLTFFTRNCECDSSCRYYDDCCIDAPGSSSRRTPANGLSCIDSDSEYEGAYAISQCRVDWSGPAEIRQKCEISTNNLSDPLAAAPATDTSHNITYKSRYCAECNNAHLSHLQSWSVDFECPTMFSGNITGNITASYIESHLNYSSSSNSWGIYYWNTSLNREMFYECKLLYGPPPYVQGHLRKCRPGVISTCASNWRRRAVQRQCEAYTAVVYTSSNTYRNPHCALCNHKELSRLSCMTGVLSRRRPAMSFTLLLDVNTRDGNRVGEMDYGCSEGSKYDPFFKKCRELVCALPGYKMVNGRCTPE